MKSDLIYVYCLTENLPEFDSKFKDEGLKSLVIGNFCIVIKYVSGDEFSEENFKRNLSNINWLEKNAREHVEIINSIMEQDTLIPFKFGTIFLSEDSLIKFIGDYSESLTENFRHIHGKEEWSVKIYCDRNLMCEQIDELSEESADLEKQISASSPGKAFLLKRKKTDLIENEMDRLCQGYGQEYFDELNNFSEATNINNLLPKEVTGREDTMILNAAFLVNKNKVLDFTRTADSIGKKEGNSFFFIETTGPWPPFSFISIKEKH